MKKGLLFAAFVGFAAFVCGAQSAGYDTKLQPASAPKVEGDVEHCPYFLYSTLQVFPVPRVSFFYVDPSSGKTTSDDIRPEEKVTITIDDSKDVPEVRKIVGDDGTRWVIALSDRAEKANDGCLKPRKN